MQEVEAMCDRVVMIKGKIVADENLEKFVNDKGGLEEAFKSLRLEWCKRAWCSFSFYRFMV